MKKIKPDGSKTIYVGGIYEVDKNSGGTVTKTTVYYPAAGAMRINGTLYFVLKDKLGSASVVTDSAGNTVGEQRYYPYGETRLTTGTLYTDKLFTGQREMAGLGIYNYGARFYSPKLGRFLSADSMVPNAANPQDFNRYSYVRNNPVRYVDPTGHVCTDPDDPTPTCYGSPLVQTKVGDRMIRGNGAELGAAKNLPKVVKPTNKPTGGSPLIPIVPDGPGSGGPVVSVVPSGECSGSSCPIVSVIQPETPEPYPFLPDYFSLNGCAFVICGQIVRDYYNNWYWGFGPGVMSSPAYSLNAGWLVQAGRSEEAIQKFTLRSSLFGGGTLPVPSPALGLGGAVTWGDPSLTRPFGYHDLAGEAQVGNAGAAGGLIYDFWIYDSGDPTPWFWQGRDGVNNTNP